ncbi:MAG: hypothetical protein KAI66_13170 [Lentisphaeria bacterium]|nr:hypothetical protein [Lentisphaeria bacterium]
MMKQLLISLLILTASALTIDAGDFGPRWMTLMDDDGRPDTGWVMLSNPKSVLRKIIVLDFAPALLEKAVLEYHIACNPYDPKQRVHVANAASAGVKWANFIIRVNGHAILDQPAESHIRKGRHRVVIPVGLLREGENRIDFKWRQLPPENPGGRQYGYIYFSVDTLKATPCHSLASADGGRSFKPDPRTEGQREFVVRLRIKL